MTAQTPTKGEGVSSTTPTKPKRTRRLPSGNLEVRYQGESFAVVTTEAQAQAITSRIDADLEAGIIPRPPSVSDPVLADVARSELVLHETRAAGGRIAPGTLEVWGIKLRPWMPGPWQAVDEAGRPFHERHLSQLDAGEVNLSLRRLEASTPSAAFKATRGLKAALRSAALGGATFPMGLLELPDVRQKPRPGRALKPDAVEWFANCWGERLATLPEFVATVGLRIGEALGARTEWWDRAAHTLFIPHWLAKERRDKWVPLFPDEEALLSRQVALIGGTSPYLWPRPEGGQWDHGGFWRRVWTPAVLLAAESWDVIAGTRYPFDDGTGSKTARLRPHDLRHTAATLMRKAGVEVDVAAARLGHKDGGWLYLTLYNHPDPDEAREALMAAAGSGLLSRPTAAPVPPANVLPFPTGRRQASTPTAALSQR